MKLSQIKARIDSVHAAHKNWWLDLETGLPKQRNVGELLCLVHSEVSEAYDGLMSGLADDHLPQYECWAVEVADALIRLFDLVGGLKISEQVLENLNWYLDEEGADFDFDSNPHYECETQDQYGLKPKNILPTELCCIIHSSISRCMEAHRKGKETEFHLNLALTICHLLGMPQCMGLGVKNNLLEILDAKVAYNKQRADHKIENRKGEHGKKY